MRGAGLDSRAVAELVQYRTVDHAATLDFPHTLDEVRIGLRPSGPSCTSCVRSEDVSNRPARATSVTRSNATARSEP